MPVLPSTESNKNFVSSDGFLHNIYVGNQTVIVLKKVLQDLMVLTEQMRNEGKSVLILTDIRKLGTVNVHARIFAVDFIKQIDFDKVAIFGNRLILEQMVNFIILASGRGFKMRYFTNITDAKNWLLE